MSMERVKELEERLNDPFICDNINLEDINDIQFLIDEYKQQNEQIEELEKVIRLAIKCNDDGKRTETYTILEQALNK